MRRSGLQKMSSCIINCRKLCLISWWQWQSHPEKAGMQRILGHAGPWRIRLGVAFKFGKWRLNLSAAFLRSLRFGRPSSHQMWQNWPTNAAFERMQPLNWDVAYIRKCASYCFWHFDPAKACVGCVTLFVYCVKCENKGIFIFLAMGCLGLYWRTLAVKEKQFAPPMQRAIGPHKIVKLK